MKRTDDGGSRAWDSEVDVVIAGAGGAGLAAAVEAASLGAQTLVLEKRAKLSDSSTALSGGALALAGTDLQARKEIADSSALLYRDLMEAGCWKNSEKLVNAYVRNQLDAYRWLSGLGVKWAGVGITSGMSVPRSHRLDPLEMVKSLKRTAESKGAIVVFQTRLTGLITDGKKRVVGISAEERAGSIRIRTRRGVVLACGGFSWDAKKLESVRPGLSRVLVVSGRGNTGDGHRLAENLGAYLKDVEHVKPTFGMHVTGTSAVDIFHGYYWGAIIVNKRGERFINESSGYKEIGIVSLDQPEGVGYQIFDQKIFDAARREVEESAIVLAQDSKGLDQARINLLVKAGTVESLACQIGVPAEALRNTLDRYNTHVRSGIDADFGRTCLAGSAGRIVEIDTPPFYAFETKANLPATYGGIAVDEDMRVLTHDGVIPGLYAAGEIIGGFHGQGYMSGTGVGKAIIFGRIAGTSAARNDCMASGLVSSPSQKEVGMSA